MFRAGAGRAALFSIEWRMVPIIFVYGRKVKPADAGGLTPTKDNNAAMRPLDRRTFLIIPDFSYYF